MNMTFSIMVRRLNLSRMLWMDMAGVISLGGTPASRQPLARAWMKAPTWSGESSSATTPVDRTTKCRSLLMSSLALSWLSIRVLLTSSAMDCSVKGVPLMVWAKISSPGLGKRTSRVIFTVLFTI